ncbi:MAG: hypothetical protein M8861_01010 [marine benthic group bacterium]|nr:hypothetical protein [Gemmatimonadota bacterium]
MTGGGWAERSLNGDDHDAEHLWILQQDEDEDDLWDDEEDEWDDEDEDWDDEDDEWDDDEEEDRHLRRPSDDDWI